MTDSRITVPGVVARGILGELMLQAGLTKTFTAFDGDMARYQPNDTVNVAVPARLAGKSYGVRGNRASMVKWADYAERRVPVVMNQDAYEAVPVTAEQATLDMSEPLREGDVPREWRSIVRALGSGVAAQVQRNAAEALAGYEAGYTLGVEQTQIRAGIARAAGLLTACGVPQTERYLTVPFSWGVVLRSEPSIVAASQVGDKKATELAESGFLGTLMGFDIFESPYMRGDEAVAYHKTAIVWGSVPAARPVSGFGESVREGDLAVGLRIAQMIETNREGAIAQTFTGFSAVKDPVVYAVNGAPSQGYTVSTAEYGVRAVKLALGGSDKLPEADSDLGRATGIHA